MNSKEYEKLQGRLTTLRDKKERQPGSGSSWRDGWRDAILAVKSMIHSEFKADSEWIPVAESLPDMYQRVLVTFKPADGYEPVVAIGFFYKFGGKTYFDDYSERSKLDDLLAWMPLPKAYEEE